MFGEEFYGEDLLKWVTSLHLHCMFDACNLKIFRVHMSAGSHKIISFIT